MSIDVKQYEKLKNNVDRLRREADKAEGAYDQLMGQLKDEFGFTNIKEAEKEIKKLQKEVKEKETKEMVAPEKPKKVEVVDLGGKNQCDICGRSFKSGRGLALHKRVHLKDKELKAGADKVYKTK